MSICFMAQGRSIRLIDTFISTSRPSTMPGSPHFFAKSAHEQNSGTVGTPSTGAVAALSRLKAYAPVITITPAARPGSLSSAGIALFRESQALPGTSFQLFSVLPQFKPPGSVVTRYGGLRASWRATPAPSRGPNLARLILLRISRLKLSFRAPCVLVNTLSEQVGRATLSWQVTQSRPMVVPIYPRGAHVTCLLTSATAANSW